MNDFKLPTYSWQFAKEARSTVNGFGGTVKKKRVITSGEGGDRSIETCLHFTWGDDAHGSITHERYPYTGEIEFKYEVFKLIRDNYLSSTVYTDAEGKVKYIGVTNLKEEMSNYYGYSAFNRELTSERPITWLFLVNLCNAHLTFQTRPLVRLIREGLDYQSVFARDEVDNDFNYDFD
jgi:hypothetical protein